MLTADLANSWQRGDKTGPRLLEVADESWTRHAEQLIDAVEQHVGARRGVLDAALDEYIGLGTDYRTLRGFIKLLLDRCKFVAGAGVNPTELREAVFLAARARHPVVDDVTRAAIWDEVGTQLALPVAFAQAQLYGDLPENQTLERFNAPTPEELLHHYNLAQAQALLYRCARLELTLTADGPTASRRALFDAIKRYRLIHRITGNAAQGYEIRLDGPVSLFHRSQKYGIQMAAFLPALLLCQGWQMRAEIEGKEGGRFWYELDSSQKRLQSSQLAGFEYAPEILGKLQTDWAKLNNGWTLEPTAKILHIGTAVLLPDAVWRDAGGREIFLEVLGFWTPDGLAERLTEFARCGFANFILLASDELRGSRDAPDNPPPQLFTYKTTPSAKSLALVVSSLAI